MKANQSAPADAPPDEKRPDQGLIGIGTMIVFIAAVIVAAIAAAVIIDSAGNLQRKASETGQETTKEVSGNLFVRNIIGNVTSDGEELRAVYWYLTLAPGAEPIDLNSTAMAWTHGSNHVDLAITNASSCDAGSFDALADGFCVRDVINVGDEDVNVLSEGDKVRVEVALSPSERVGTRDLVEILILPDNGAPVQATFKTPAAFGQNNNLRLS